MRKRTPNVARLPLAARIAAATAVVSALVCALALCVGCTQVKVDEDSPRIADVCMVASGQTEASQSVEIRLAFDQPVSVAANVADSFSVQLNGAALDASTVKLEVRSSADAVTFVLRPAEGAALGPGAGSYFALYQGQLTVAAAREDGALPSILGASGSCAVLEEPIRATLPSGLAIQTVSVRAGSEADNLPAQTVFQVTSPALVRAITWFSPDGGQTKLLKHNHTFADADAAACAGDLAKVVNAASGLGITATAQGDTVTLTAQEVRDGQTIDPMVVEGRDVEGGSYDPAQGVGAAA